MSALILNLPPVTIEKFSLNNKFVTRTFVLSIEGCSRLEFVVKQSRFAPQKRGVKLKKKKLIH